MNTTDMSMLITSFVILAFYYKKAQYGRRAVPYLVFAVPLLYFSINMLTESVTMDEYWYMRAFIDIENIENYITPMKAVYEYRTSQMIFGTICKMISSDIKNALSLNALLQIYKMIHYNFFFGISLFISWIWRNKILEKEIGSIRFRLTDNIILYSLLALPVSCLLLKVCNYDASNVYFAVLGFSLAAAAEKQDSPACAFAGTAAALFGCMDKWPGLMYWCCCVVFYIYIGVRRMHGIKRLLYAVEYCILAAGAGAGISWLNLLYLKFLEKGLCAEINIGNVLFPFTYTLRALAGKEMSINYEDEAAYCDGSFAYLFVLMAVMLMCALCMCMYDDLNTRFKGNASRILAYTDAFLLGLMIAGGGIGAYFIPQYIAPYKKIEEGFYLSKDTFDGWVYHYGASGAAGHFMCKLFYAYAVIICTYPTAVLLWLILGIYMLVRKNKEIMPDSFMHAILFICLIQPVLFSAAGLPAGGRYYGMTILLLAILCSYYIYKGNIVVKCSIRFSRIAVSAAVILCAAEMMQFAPVISIFSPAWLVHSEDYKKSIRKGTWHAGEAMTWGEDMSIAGNIIKRRIDELGIEDYSQISIYCNYGYAWLANPGFHIGTIDKGAGASNYKWDDTEYIVLSKYALFRHDIPEFIHEVEPAAVIAYNGEISSWIYTGSQLEGYREYFD